MTKTRAKATRPKRKIKKAETQDYFVDMGVRPDYKDVLILRRFLTERGRILPQKISGLTAKNQRRVSAEIKKSRFIALLPYEEQHAL